MPPPSWQQARPPEVGEFTPDRQEEARDYLQSYTMITGLAVLADSILIVAHGRYQEDPLGRIARAQEASSDQVGLTESKYQLSIVTSLLDVYINGERVAADVPAPGDIFGNWGDIIYILRSNSPALNWTLTQFTLRGLES